MRSSGGLEALGTGRCGTLGQFHPCFSHFHGSSGPARQLAGQQADPEVIADLRARFGLDHPLGYATSMPCRPLSPLGTAEDGGWGAEVALFGREFCAACLGRLTVDASLARHGPVSLCQHSSSQWYWGFPWGLLAARNPGGWFDRIAVGGSVLGMSAPSFFMAILLGYVFAVKVGGWTGLPLTGSLWDLDRSGPKDRWRCAT